MVRPPFYANLRINGAPFDVARSQILQSLESSLELVTESFESFLQLSFESFEELVSHSLSHSSS